MSASSFDGSVNENFLSPCIFKDEIKHDCIEVSSASLKIPQQLAVTVSIPEVENKWGSHYSKCLFFVDKVQHLYHSSNYFCPYDVVVCENNPVSEFPRKLLRSSLELC